MCACDHPRTLADLRRYADLHGDCGSPPDRIPKWLDMDQFKRGQQFFQKHMMSITMSMHFSLVSGFAIINLLEPLVFTRQSDTPRKALKRYISTFNHILLWCTDLTIWEGASSIAYRSVTKVRHMHNRVAEAMNHDVGAMRFVSQYDMGLVQSGFMGAIVMYSREFGVSCSEEELEDYIHLWRGIGHLLGIDDRCNICSGNYRQTWNLVKEIERELLIPALKDPPEHFYEMSQAYIDGMNIMMKPNLNSRESMLALVCENFGLPVPKLSLADTFRFYAFKVIMLLLFWIPCLEAILNKRLESLVKFIQKEMSKRE